tara:strand:- start:74 stop:568 length:495 start_codon:yes stop_codon:yes gene_type:complete
MNYRIFDNEANSSNNKNNDFLRPKMSNESKPIHNSHESYIFDRNAELFYKNNMGNYMQPMNSRKNDANPVQSSFQNNYFTNNFETLNNNQEQNMFLDRNPVNTRRDTVEKIRNSDRYTFIEKQGGNLNNFVNFETKNTRTNKKNLNPNSYIPMGKTMPIPKDNI